MKKFIIALAVGPALFACGPQPPTGTGGTGGSGGSGGSGGGGTGTSTGLPCDVQKVLEINCMTCHGKTLAAGAPMSLTSWDDTQRNLGAPVWQMMRDRINSTDSSVRMPPTGPMSDADKAVLNAWFAAGTPRSSDVCQTGTNPDCVGPQCLPCTPTHTMVTYSGVEGSGQKYTVAAGPGYQNYINFSFRNPFAPGETAIANAPVVDNSAVLHHYILYGIDATGGQTHVAGWAPGGTNGVMPDDVSELLDYVSFTMQVHYFNNTSQTQQDASGVAFCTTTTPRQHLAGVFTLGQYLISIPPNSTASAPPATCSVQRAMTIIGTSPHMHQIGYGFLTTHTRGGTNLGNLSYIPNGAWSFDLQKHYPMIPRRDVQVGDVLQTTCTYRNTTSATVTFGPATQNEMCFDFMTVYPYSSQMRSCSGGPTP